jgi:coenzyme F420 biosynthesis associated uncharacterized protein
VTAGGIDWALAERVANRVAARHPTSSLAPIGGHDIHPLVADAARRVSAETGLHPPGDAVVQVVDRAGWINASIGSFRRLLGPVFERAAERAPGPSKLALGRLGAVELGALTGWLSGRVLGQYDVLVAGDSGDEADVVYIVGPNMSLLEERFGFDPQQFRTWVVLHELTHRAQFRGVPWMRDHYLALIGEVLDGVDTDPGRLLATLRETMSDRAAARQRVRDGGAAALFMPPEQRSALERVGGLMSLLEGHGDVVMDRAGADILPEATRFSRVLSERRRQQNPAARTVQRLLGFEAKLNQYRAGEAFVAAIETAGGSRAIDTCWVEPANLPTSAEIRDPSAWLGRLGIGHAVA